VLFAISFFEGAALVAAVPRGPGLCGWRDAAGPCSRQQESWRGAGLVVPGNARVRVDGHGVTGMPMYQSEVPLL